MMRAIATLSTVLGLFVFLTACGKKDAAGKATANMSNIASALNPPTAGGTGTRWAVDSDGIPYRAGSRAGCETIQASKLYRFFLMFPRLSVCLYGALEKRAIISQPSTAGEYNYYAFNSARASSTLRYGKDSKGNLSINLCQTGDTTNRAEIYVANATDSSTLTLTNVNTAPSATTSSTMQFVITAKVNDEGSAAPYEFQKASGVLGGNGATSAASTFYIEKGADRNILKESYGLGSFSRKLYSEWGTGVQGTSKAILPSLGTSAIVDTWKDDSTYACIAPRTTGTYYSSVNAFDLATLGTPTTPTFVNSWTCNDLGGKTLQTVTLPSDNQELLKEVTACFSGIGLDDSTFIQSCGSVTACAAR